MQLENEQLINEAAQDIAAEPPETDEEIALVEGLASSEQKGRVQNASGTYNLVTEMDEGLLREIGQEASTGFKDDCSSLKEWLGLHAFWLSLYLQQDYSENADAERSWGATESIPILTEACNQFQARTYKAFFPNDSFVSALPMRKTTKNREELDARAKRIGNHMSYQLGYVDRHYKKDKDALFLAVALHGSFFTKTYFNDKIMRFKVDNVRPTDLVVDYNVGPIRIEEVRRKSHIIYTTVGMTDEAVSRGYFDSPCEPSLLSIIDNEYNVKADQGQAIVRPNMSLKRDMGAVCIEQHAYFDLGDGFKPYIVTYDLATNKVKRMTIGWEADNNGRPIKDYEQIQYFTHYKYRENPDGFYGYGLGHDIGDLNSAINIMLRQSMDAATLANDGNMSGFINELLGIEGDEVRLVLGKFGKIPASVGDIASNIYQFKFPGPNEAQLKMMEMLDARAQRMSSTVEATTGTMDKVVQPTTYITQVEQALEGFSSVQMRLASSMADEFQKIYDINRKYMPAVEYYIVNETPELITRADYSDDMMVQPIFDPKYATQGQKVARSQAIAQIVMQNPLTQTRPQVMDELTRIQLEAMDADNIDKLVPATEPMRMDDPIAENMNFMMPPGQGEPFDVFPDQNHILHMAAHQKFMAEQGESLLPEQQAAVMTHIMKHGAYFYGQQNGIVPPPQQAGNPALDAGQNNQMDIAGAIPPPSGMA